MNFIKYILSLPGRLISWFIGDNDDDDDTSEEAGSRWY